MDANPHETRILLLWFSQEGQARLDMDTQPMAFPRVFLGRQVLRLSVVRQLKYFTLAAPRVLRNSCTRTYTCSQPQLS
jgi:hypothetical protein